MPNGEIPHPVTFQVKIAQGLKAVPAADWDICAVNTALATTIRLTRLCPTLPVALEDSGCAGEKTGWSPVHVLVEDEAEKLLGAAPCYLSPIPWASTFSTIPGGCLYPRRRHY